MYSPIVQSTGQAQKLSTEGEDDEGLGRSRQRGLAEPLMEVILGSDMQLITISYSVVNFPILHMIVLNMRESQSACYTYRHRWMVHTPHSCPGPAPVE